MPSKVCERCELKMGVGDWDTHHEYCKCEVHYWGASCVKRCVCREIDFSVRLQQVFQEANFRPCGYKSPYDATMARCRYMTAYPRWKRHTFVGSTAQKTRNFVVHAEVRKWINRANPEHHDYDSDSD